MGYDIRDTMDFFVFLLGAYMSLNGIDYRENESLKNCTSFKTGGNAKYISYPKNKDEIIRCIDFCKRKDIKYIVVGNGSNLLFTDDGYDGMVIRLYPNMREIRAEGELIYADAGALLSAVSKLALDNSLTGMEFAAGIPGTIGGAMVMNAGAYGGEMKDIVKYTDMLLGDGSIRRYSADEMDFSYRHSILLDEAFDGIVIGACLKLEKGEKSRIEAVMKELAQKRIEKQPLEYPSAGSTFKRPNGYFAGKLIEDSGLKGYRVGGAMVSEKHCGFVINYDNATSGDILKLIDDVKNIVYEKQGVMLEPEVKIVR